MGEIGNDMDFDIRENHGRENLNINLIDFEI